MGQTKSSVVEFSFTGADFGYDKGVGHFYGRSLTLEQARNLDVLLVYEMNGQSLPPQHGSPLRLIVPGWYGMASVKWLTDIKALSNPYDGFQQIQTYRYRESIGDVGRPVTEILVKSLLVPPGVPDFVTRDRCLKAGTVRIEGRAWSGAGKNISKIELGINGNWKKAKILNKVGKYAWTKWIFDWDAEPDNISYSVKQQMKLVANSPQHQHGIWEDLETTARIQLRFLFKIRNGMTAKNYENFNQHLTKNFLEFR